MYFGIGRMRKMPVDVFPEFAPPMVEIQTICLGLAAEEVESLVTAPMELVLNGVPGAGRPCARSRFPICRRSRCTSSPRPTSWKPGSWSPSAWHDLTDAADLGRPAGDAATPVGDQPLHEDRDLVEKPSLIDLSMITYWTIRQRLLRVPGRRQRGHVGRADRDAAGPGRAGTAEQTQASRSTRSMRPHRGRSKRRLVPVLRRPPYRHRRLDRYPQSAAANPARPALGHQIRRRQAGRPGQCAARRPEWSTAVAERRGRSGHRSSADGRRRDRQRRARPAADRREIPLGQHACRSQGRWRRRSTRCGRVFPMWTSTPRSFVRRRLSRCRSTTSPMRCSSAACSWSWCCCAFLYEWRSGADQLHGDAAVADGGRAGALLRGDNDQHDDSWRGSSSPWATSSMTPSSTSKTSCGACASIARRAANVRSARIILDASLEVRSAIIYATLIEVLALLPVFFMEGLSGAFFKPLAMSYALALLASMIVALTVTPAMAYSPAQRPARAPRVADRAAGCSALSTRCWRRSSARRAPAYATVGVSCWPASWFGPAWAVAAADVQGAGLPDALADQARHLLAGDGPHHHSGQQGAAGHSRRPQLRRPHRPGPHHGRSGRHVFRRELGQRRSRPSTTTRRWPRFRRPSTAILACTATCRRT